MVHFRIKSVAEVVAERRNVVQEKYTGRGASSRRFVQKIGEMTFFLWAVQHRCLFFLVLVHLSLGLKNKGGVSIFFPGVDYVPPCPSGLEALASVIPDARYIYIFLW